MLNPDGPEYQFKETHSVIKRKATIFSLTMNFTFSTEQNIYFLY